MRIMSFIRNSILLGQLLLLCLFALEVAAFAVLLEKVWLFGACSFGKRCVC